MTQRYKAAWIALIIISCLSIIKFSLYFLSGSIAVLSESWHSITDIITTLLVLFSIIRQNRKEKIKKYTKEKGWKNFVFYVQSIHTEMKISLTISFALFFIALSILWQSIASSSTPISSPLITGIIFIILSFGSFFLYRFEANIAAVEKSAALTADSQHNRADMIISLMTGISLIGYYFGYNIDRIIGCGIAFYILSFAIELFINTLFSILHKKKDMTVEYNFTSIIWSIFNKERLRKVLYLFDKKFYYSEKVIRILSQIKTISEWTGRWLLRLTLFTFLLWYISTALYIIPANSEALVLRFGKIVGKQKRAIKNPGLHCKLPFPIDTIKLFPSHEIQKISVGNILTEEMPMIWTKEHGENQSFIAGDNTLFLPYISIHYYIENIIDYYKYNRDDVSKKLLKSLTLQVLNKHFSTTEFYDLALFNRRKWIEKCRKQLQKENDNFHTGIKIIDIYLIDLHPPTELAISFEDVVAAEQLKQRSLNDAKRRVTALLSMEKIASFRSLAKAESYVHEKRTIAEGETKNYLLRYSGYVEGGDTMKDLLLMQTAEKTLRDKRIFLIDPKSGIEDKIIYMERYLFEKKRR